MMGRQREAALSWPFRLQIAGRNQPLCWTLSARQRAPRFLLWTSGCTAQRRGKGGGGCGMSRVAGPRQR